MKLSAAPTTLNSIRLLCSASSGSAAWRGGGRRRGCRRGLVGGDGAARAEAAAAAAATARVQRRDQRQQCGDEKAHNAACRPTKNKNDQTKCGKLSCRDTY